MRILTILFISFIYIFGANIYKKGSVVIDEENALMWQDTKDNITIIKTHITAQDYCETLTLDSFDNWRMPDNDEYEYIIDRTREDGQPMINMAFRYALPVDYWTDDRTWRTFGRYGYYVFFKSGNIYYENRSYPKLVRCIRDIE